MRTTFSLLRKSRRVTVRLALPGATANTFISLCVIFLRFPSDGLIPEICSVTSAETTKHMSAYTHASRKTHKKKCRCYIIKDALCWFRLGEACGQEMDTWTFCGCFSEWSEVKHSYGWKISVICCQRFPDT